MAQIENNIQAAQRRAALQYDRAVSEAKRTGKSQEVDGVTLVRRRRGGREDRC